MTLKYTLRRSKRKTVGVYITRDAQVEVRAPLKLSKAYIDSFVASKEEWIASNLIRRERLNREKSAFALNYGDTVMYRGKLCPIRAGNAKDAGFDGECLRIPPDLTPDGVKRVIVRIYKETAKGIIGSMVCEWADRMNVKPAGVKITGAKTRWGSCSGKNSLSFSWRLAMAGDDVVEYIVAHELAHIREHNHSPRFWVVVGEVIPDVKALKMKLKALQERLMREEWG